MAITGSSTLRKIKKLYTKTGVPAGTVKIVLADRQASVHNPGQTTEPISLGNAILNDADDRASMGITDLDTEVVRIWGGAIESSGLYQVTEEALKRAKLPGGGIIIFDRFYKLKNYEAGFSVKGVVSEWTLVCEGQRK
jgi:hypothetical protein